MFQPLPPVRRDDARDFARRTLKNLAYIQQARQQGVKVHLVTQLANSLLGLIVFPCADRTVIEPVEIRPLDELARDGWPLWSIQQDDDEKEETTTLGRLIYHLRNAIAHRRVAFSSDSPNLRDVTLHVHDAKSANAPVYWRASINAEDLLSFCERLAGFIDEALG